MPVPEYLTKHYKPSPVYLVLSKGIKNTGEQLFASQISRRQTIIHVQAGINKYRTEAKNIKTISFSFIHNLKVNTSAYAQALAYSLIFSHLSFIPYVQANPNNGNIVGGVGHIHNNGTNTIIHQGSSSLAINWDTFNVNTNERVQYLQPDTNSIALNLILDNNGSQILGRIDANGKLILVNPNGIFFGANSQVNAGSLIASGLTISPTDFMNGSYIFNEVLGSNGTVINKGLLNAAAGGSVTLLGKRVVNEGVISATLGRVNMAAGRQASLIFNDEGTIGVKITKEILQDELGIDPALLNSGEINAEGGQVLLTASVSRDVFSQAVNSGTLSQATSVIVNADGSMSLKKGADVINSGAINVSSTSINSSAGDVVVIGENITQTGRINANAQTGNAGNIELHANNKVELQNTARLSAKANTNGSGGKVKILGDKVGLLDNSVVDVSGANGGGEALIGGDKQGQNKAIRNAEFLHMGENTKIVADALENGDGGKIITFANNTARIYGNLYARGGAVSGNGGFIETSGKQGFEILNAADISATNGNGGLWLIDPRNITIQQTTDTNIAQSGSSNPTYTANGDDATIGVDTLLSALAGGNVTVYTNGLANGNQAGNITFDADLDFNGIGTGRTLTLTAFNDIDFTANASAVARIYDSATKTADNLNVVLNANDGGSNKGNGNITLNANTTISTRGGDFTASGVGFNSGAATIDVGAGSIDLDGIVGDVGLGSLTANGSASDLFIRNATNIFQQTGFVNISRDSFLGGSSTNNIDLFGSFGGFIDLQADIALVRAFSGITLNSGSTINDILFLTSEVGTIDTNGFIIVGNEAIFNAAGDVTFSNANNDFNIVNIINASNVQLRDGTGEIDVQGNVSGSLEVTADGTNLDGYVINNSAALNVTGLATFTVTNGESINLGNAANTFSIDPIFNVVGGTINNLVITDDTSLVLQKNLNLSGSLTASATDITFNNTSVAKNLTATSTAGQIQQSPDTTLNISGTSTLDAGTEQNIILANTGNDFNNVNIINAKDVQLRDGVGGIVLGDDGDGSGAFTSNNLTVTSTDGDITQANAINTANLTLDAGSNNIALDTPSTLNNISGAITITNANDARINNNRATQIQNASITNDFIINTTNGTLSLGGADQRVSVGRDLTAAATGMITQTGTIFQLGSPSTLTVGRNTQLTARNNTSAVDQNITLTNAGNDFNNVNIVNANNVQLRDGTGAIGVQGNISGFLNVRADGSIPSAFVITNPSELNVIGSATFTVTNGESINLGSAANTFTKDPIFNVVDGTTNNLVITDDSNLVLQPDLNLSGNLTASATNITFRNTSVAGNLTATSTTGQIQQSLGTTLNITGTSTLNGGNGGIALGELNNFQDTVSLSTTSADTASQPSNVTLTDANLLNIGVSSIAGELNVRAETVTQTNDAVQGTGDGISVANTATFTVDTGNSITLDNIDNQFNAITFSANTPGQSLNNVTISNSGSLDLRAINLTGNLTATSLGNLTQNNLSVADAINVAGATQLNANIISLNNTANNLNDLTISSGSTVSITNANALNFTGASTISDSLTVNALSGNITDATNAALTVTNNTSLTTASGDIVLDNGLHDFNSVQLISSGNTTLTDLDAIDFAGTSTVDGALNITLLRGDITSSGAINVGGLVTLSSTGDINLTSSADDNTINRIRVNAANNVNVGSASALILDTINLNGQLQVSANGITTTNDLLASTGMNLNAGTGTLAINNNLTTNSGALTLIADQDINQSAGATISGSAINLTSNTANINQNGIINNSAGDLTLNAAQSIIMAANASTQSTGNINYLSTFNQSLASLTSSGGGISVTSSSGAINDINANNINLSAASLVLRASSGIGSGNSLETTTAQLDVINTGIGASKVEIKNTGEVLVTNLVNNGDINFDNTASVTLDNIDAGFTVGALEMNVESGSVFGVDRGIGSAFVNIADITADTAIIFVSKGEFGTLGRPIVLNINSEFFLSSTFSSTFFLGGSPQLNNDISNIQFSVFDSINSVSGQQLIEVESLADIDRAIFTDLHNYDTQEISLRLPRDQIFEDDLDAYDRE